MVLPLGNHNFKVIINVVKLNLEKSFKKKLHTCHVIMVEGKNQSIKYRNIFSLASQKFFYVLFLKSA